MTDYQVGSTFYENGNTSVSENEPGDPDVIGTMLNETPDDDGNARCAYALFGGQFLFCDAYGWLVWDNSCWRRDEAEAKIDRAIFALLKRRRVLAVQNEKEAVVKATQGSTKRMRDCKAAFKSLVNSSVNEFDNSPDEINVKNGVLNLRTGKLKDHHASQRFTYCIETPYIKTALQDEWIAFLSETVYGGEDALQYLKMAVGYSLTGYTTEECLWYIWGPARSGKGTFTETIIELLGHPLSIETDFSTFTMRREPGDQGFDLAPLKPARLVFASESNSNEWLNTGKVKRMTGGNMITCAFKHRDQFSYRPHFKIWLSSNHPVRADVDDDAVWGRVKVLHFPNSHLGKEDKNLKLRMRNPANLAGVLAWAVEGAQEWYRSNQGLFVPTEVQTSIEQARQQVDFVQAWIDECAQPDPESWSSNKSIYGSYYAWCKANGVSPKSQRGLALALQTRGYKTGEARKIDGKTQKGVVGLGAYFD